MIEEKNENQETEEIEKVEPESEEIETPIDEVTSEEITQSRFGPEDLEAAIKTRDRKALIEIFETIPDADIAEAAEEIDIKELITLFRYAKPSLTAPLFAELSQDKKEELVTAMSDRELYKKYKTAETEEEREEARQKYLDSRGIPESFRW